MNNEKTAVRVLICITILPSLLSVILALVGITSYISLIAYGIGLLLLANLSGHKDRIGKDLFFLLFYLFFFLFSISYSISKQTSIDKVIGTVYNILFPVGLLMVISRYKINWSYIEERFIAIVKKYSNFILIFLFLLLLLGFTEKGDGFNGRETIIGMRNAIWCSRFVGFLILVHVIAFVRKKIFNLFDLLGLLSALFIMIRSGSRGPLLAIMVVSFLMLFPHIKARYKAALLLLFIVVFEAFMLFSSRSFTSGEEDYSGLARLEMYNKVFDVDSISFLGTGIGGFSQFLGGDDILFYPHNLFLETYVEVGLIGLFLVVLLLIKLYKVRDDKSSFSMFCLYFFVNAMVSGDITGNNYFFIFAAIMLLSYKKRKAGLVYNCILKR